MPEYQDLLTDAGVLRVTYEMTAGDMIISACLISLIVVILIRAFIQVLWRR